MPTQAHRLAGERVIEVHGYSVSAYSSDDALDAEAIGINHRQGSTYMDHLGVKLAVDLKEFLIEGDDKVIGTLSVSLIGSGNDIKLLADSQALESALQGDYHTLCNAIDDTLGVFLIDLVHQFLGAVILYLIQVVDKFYVHSFCYFIHK